MYERADRGTSSPRGILHPKGTKFNPEGQLHPWGSNLAPMGEVKNWPVYPVHNLTAKNI
jgi:hypothetical protein